MPYGKSDADTETVSLCRCTIRMTLDPRHGPCGGARPSFRFNFRSFDIWKFLSCNELRFRTLRLLSSHQKGIHLQKADTELCGQTK